MKKNIILSLLCLLAISSRADNQSFTFEGKIGTWNAPAKLYFSYWSDGNEQLDSTILVNGQFSFKGAINEPSFCRLFMDYSGNGIASAAQAGHVLYFYVEPGTVKMESPDSLQNGKFINSPVNNEFQAYLDKIGGQVQDIAAKMNQKMWQATPEQQADPEFKKQLDVEFRRLHTERGEKQIQFAKENPNSFFSVVAISEGTPPKFDEKEVEPIFLSINEKHRNTYSGKAFAQRITAAKSIGVGKKAPIFTQNDPNGKPISLSDFAGKYVLLDFWASWCGPCRQENPNLVKVYAAYKDKGFEILGVSLDDQKKKGKEAWLNAIEKDKLTWPQVSDLNSWNNAAARVYGVRAVPTNFLIDPQGVVVAQDLRGEELAAYLEKLFGAGK